MYVSRIERLQSDPENNFHELISQKFYTEILIYHIRGISNEKGIKEFEKNSNQLKIK